MIRKILEGLIDCVYPPRCPICNKIIPLGGSNICTVCSKKVTYVEEPYCLKCGKPVDDERELCCDCSQKEHNYDEGRSTFIYDEYMSRSVYRFKYNSKKEYAKFYGEEIFKRLNKKIISWNAEAIIPVPIHKMRMKQRGFNQANLLAKELSKYTKIPVKNNIVYRKNQTKVQKNLSAKERENNIKKAFIVKKNSVELNSVIIIDDIYTTGSTVDAISACLKAAGVKKVYVVTLCIGRGI